MEQLSKLKPGDVLDQVDLGSYVLAMAKGVAEAQKALDDNTVGLLGTFSQPIAGLAGKSLLQLGLSPAFYHFRSATISASVSMSIRVRQEFEIGVHVGFGQSQGSSSTSTSSAQQASSANSSLTFEDHFTAKSSTGTQGMEAIDSYSSSNDSSHFVLGERVALASSAKAGLQSDRLVRYDSTAELYVVPAAAEKHWAVIGLAGGSTATDSFNISAANPSQPGVTGSAEDLATALKTDLIAKSYAVYILTAVPGSDDLRKVLFTTNSYLVKSAGDQARLRALAHIAAAIPNSLTVTGYTDGVGPADYNKRLSELRAQSVAAILRANGATVSAIAGVGEQGVTSQSADQARRKAEVGFTSALSRCYLYIEGSTPFDPQIGSNSWYLTKGDYDSDGIGVLGKTAVANAASLVTQLNSISVIEAQAIGELVYLTNSATSSSQAATVRVYKEQSSSQQTEQTTDLGLTEDASSSSSGAQGFGKQAKTASAFAASVDARFSRMFDVSMSGNMSIAAELVCIPAPPEFLQLIKDYLGD